MKFRVNTKQRYLSVFLAVLFVVNGLFIGANIFVAADETIMYEGDTLRGWQVDCVWENGTKDLDIVSDRREDLTLKLSVTYYAPLSCMTQDYPPGTVKFSIPDFGVLKRSGTSFQAKTVADQADTDWNCQYDVQSQMYVFTNAKTFEAEKPLSGGFEILWVAASRQSMTDFSMTESPLFTIENECTRMTPVSLTCETKRDFYIIDLERELISYQQFEDPSINKSGYVSYNYKTYFYLNEKARAGYLNSYFIKVSFNNDTVTDQQMSDIIAQYWDGNKKTETRLTQLTDPVTNETVWGFYRFVDKETESLGYYNSYNFILSYPRSLISKTATVDTDLLVLYYDENEYVKHKYSTDTGEKLFDSDNVEINEYRFWYGNGNFSMIKYSPYEKDSYTNGGTTPEKYSDRLLAKKIFRNEKVTFTLGGGYRMSTTTSAGTKTTSSSSQTDSNANGYIGSDAADLKTGFDFILGDDRLSVDLNDGSFRMLKGDEYTFTRVIGPVDSQKCDYELYVSNVAYNTSSIDPETGAEIPKVAAENEYRLFGVGNTEELSVFDLTNIASHAGFEDYTDGVKAIYIKIKNFVGEYNPTYRADIAFHFDLQSDLALEESKRINTNGKITDYGFMRAFYTGTHNDAFSIEPVNFLREAGDSADIQNFAQLLMALDDGGYGRYLYHSMSNVFLRDVVTIVSSETTVTSKARSKAEGGGYKINIDSKGTIKVKDESPGELERFSLYVKIPPLLTIDNRLSDIELSGCYGVNQFGETVGNTDFENNVTYSLITLSDGDRAIVADFDFSENPLEISQTTFINLKIPAQVLYTDLKTTVHRSFEVRTFTMVQDEGIGKVEGFEYYWNRQFAALDTYDLNRNGRTDEVLGGSYHGVSYENIVEQWVDTATKLVKSYRDEVWKLLYDSTVDDWYSETEVNAYSSELGENENKRATYAYRLSIDLGSGASDIMFSDVLENEKIDDNEVTWRGTLNSIDFTYAIGLGLVPSVYYSTQEIEYQERRQNNGVWVNNLDQFSSDTASEWNDGIWTAPVSGIRSLAIRFSTAALTDGIISKKHIYFVENLTAPELTPASVDPDRPQLGLYARNKHTVYYKSKNLNTRIRLDSKNASVKLLPPVVLVKMIKKDGETGKVLTGAEFSFFTDAEGTEPVIDWEGNIIAQNVRLNNFGELDIDNLEPGIYWYKETVPPAGYHLDPTLRRIDLQHYDVSYLDNSSYVIPNERLTGTIVFTKKDGDDEYVEGIPNAVYALFDANGISVFTDENNAYQETGGTKTEFTTDENGQIVITNLPWGNYYLLEQSAPEGYDMNDTKVWANVSRNVNVEEQTEANAIVVYCHQYDTEQTAAIRLTKYDRDGVTPLANAWFSLERKNGLDEWQTVPAFEYIKTGRNGIVTAEELKFGTYRFKEIIAPTGYELDTENQYSDEVTLTAQTVGTTLKVTKTNERILGSATLRKYSDDGIPLNGAKFDLYMVSGEIDTEPLQSGDTEDIAIRLGMETKTINGQTGMLETVTGLDWGKYYFKEFSSPSGYSKDDGIYSFEVTAENAAITFDSFKPENERKKGEVVLNKTVGEPVPVVGHNYSVGEGIPNAEFELFTSAGAQVYVKSGSKEVTDPIRGVVSIVDCYTVCESTDADAIRTMKTNADGQLRVDGIFWGSYYFEETKAPDGFSLSEKVRFTVNAASCLAVQELECEDYAMKCLIRIDKEIDNKLEVFGTPTFTFKVINTDTNADYTRMITLSGEAMSGTATVQVPVGNYRIYEVSVNRYKLVGTEYVEAGTTVPAENRSIVDNEFFVTLSSESGVPQTAEVKFTNSLENYFGISHTDAINNIIPTKRKVTGFSLELNDEYIACARTEHNNFVITKDMLSGVINYDDGTSTAMDETQLNSVLPQNWTIDNGYLNAGQAFMLNAQFTEGGKTYKTNFVATVGPYKVIESQKVIFRADLDNKSVFEIGGKLMGVNTVYYNSDDNDNKIVVSGEYVTPTVVTGDGSVMEWEILSGPDAGQKIKAKNDAVAQYLKDNYDNGLRELELRAVINGLVVDFDYTGEVQEFIAPYDGIYYIEGWGAQGGWSMRDDVKNPRANPDDFYKVEGGRGGYSYGYVYLRQGESVYVAVGGEGGTYVDDTASPIIGYEPIPGGFNGGGKTGDSDANGYTYNGAGGGATHFAINNNLGVLKNYVNNKNDVLLVAGGGGGSGFYQAAPRAYVGPQYKYQGYGGYGGGLSGGSNSEAYNTGLGGVYTANGGTQNAGGTTPVGVAGSFGQGGEGAYTSNATGRYDWYCGGGGGWYGGASSLLIGGGGGSGHVGDNMIMGETIGGNNTFKAPDGTDEIGHVGDGHARITYVQDTVDIPYTGHVGSFTAPVSGLYQLEAWGAQGGDAKVLPNEYKNNITQEEVDSWEDAEGGRGGYSYGYVYLREGEIIYMAVGGKGDTFVHDRLDDRNCTPDVVNGGYNGGGRAMGFSFNNRSIVQFFGSGGGATHFATTNKGVLYNYNSSQSDVLLVAGGGGGSGATYTADVSGWMRTGYGGQGGGETGLSTYNYRGGYSTDDIMIAYGGSQTAGGTFAGAPGYASRGGAYGIFGAGGYTLTINNGICGGGGGWYGGGSTKACGGAGGSGHVGENMVSGETIAGDQTFKAPDGTDETGHTGNGYARVTLIPTTSTNYDYTGTVQTFTAPKSGTYLLEAWGAQGGGSVNLHGSVGTGGKGGYSYGYVHLTAGEKVYLAVGGNPSDHDTSYTTTVEGGYNGGGSTTSNSDTVWGAGGGATHFAFALENGSGDVLSAYSDPADQSRVLLVAGGGGGSGSRTLTSGNGHTGGYGGGEIAGNGESSRTTIGYGMGGTQSSSPKGSSQYQTKGTKAGSFGQGANGIDNNLLYGTSNGGSGGGGGWYGGSAGFDYGSSAGGGSGHVGDSMISGETISGDQTFAAPDGTNETGHSGNGYARITYLG